MGRICDNQSEPRVYQCRTQYMNSGGKDDVSGHYTVEQTSTIFFTDMEEGVEPMSSTYNSSCERERERVSIFSVSVQNFVSSYSS